MLNVKLALVAVSLAAAAIAFTPRLAAAKCSGGAQTYAVSIDGRMVGEFRMSEQMPPDVLPPASEIFWLQIVCRDFTTPEQQVTRGQPVIAVLTRAALPELIESYLQEMVEAQAGRFASTGQYEQSLAELALLEKRVASRPGAVEGLEVYHGRNNKYTATLSDLITAAVMDAMPIEIVATASGWSATAAPGGLDTVCHVVVGSAEPPHAGLRPGVPECFSAEPGASTTAAAPVLQIRGF